MILPLSTECASYLAGRMSCSIEDIPRLEAWDICKRIGGDNSPLGVSILESMLGKPILRCSFRRNQVAPRTQLDQDARAGRPGSVADGTDPASAVPAPRARRRSPSDPRVLIYVLPNPKQHGSAARRRYDLYKVGLTIDQVLELGVTRADIRWDLKQGFILAEFRREG